jgi:hypothetical protein
LRSASLTKSPTFFLRGDEVSIVVFLGLCVGA